MEKIKEPSVAGSFYTSDKQNLQSQIKTFKEESKNLYNHFTRLVIVPHAGLIYSGRLAYEGISMLNPSIKNIFIIAPSHRVAFEGLALSSYDGWNTPLGNIMINKEICDELVKEANINYNDEALAFEHSIEIQIPIVQSIFNSVKIIPILVGRENPEIIEKILKTYYSNPENGFIISSDLSHYLKDKDAKKLDEATAVMIENGKIEGFKYEQACGAIGICGAIQFANEKNYSFIRIDMTNSSQTSHDTSSVVGYGCWFLYEGSKNKFIEKNYSQFLIELVKIIIRNNFENKQIRISYPQVFDEFGACFVTLEKFGQLRGCIGSIVAHQPLINDLVAHSKDAAFNDFRFSPVTEDEIPYLKVAVSILSEPVKIEFDTEEDLLNKITPNIDGIIIRDKNYQAVYLPSVWSEIPNKKDFLNSLKVKAGLSADYFSPSFEAYRFYATYIKE